ncbi:ribose-5-phosphate isomerase [Neodiprion virginianus]|uniref:ribose-5-phosphate isomerase n=1 Tax=Neodiprion virginianus TaxID=2961670 RepID=UPI00076FC9A2|nr:ribose-5-phosphate isomerase [Neodiprion virginianus]
MIFKSAVTRVAISKSVPSRIGRYGYEQFSKVMGPLESAKKAAAYKAVDEYVKDNSIIGIGSGSTVIYAVHRLAERVREENLRVICIPTSFQARQLIINHHLALSDLEIHPKLSCTIDGADEVDAEMNLLKGGGGCLLQEKIVASCSDELIIVADYTKNSQRLGEQFKKGVSIEVIPLAYVPIKQKILENLGGSIDLRMAKAKLGPVLTDNGNFILDWHFPNNITDWNKINTEILLLPGVVETGIFINMAKKAYFGMADGSVKEQSQV